MASFLLDKLLPYIPSNNRLERIWKLAQVDFQARYYNDRLGLLWALIKPLFEVALYFVVFTELFKVEQENFPIYLFGGIVMWTAFAEASTKGMNLLQSKLYLIDNIQFEHIDIFISHVASVFFGFIFNFLSFLVIVIIFDENFQFQIFPLTVVLVTLFSICLGASFILATIQPFVKDLIHIWDMVIMAGMWASGILYHIELIEEKFTWFIFANPLIGTIWNGRACLLGNIELKTDLLIINFISSQVILWLGYFIFKSLSSKAIEKL